MKVLIFLAAFVALAYANDDALTKCQKEVIEKKKIVHHGVYIPQCKADGSFNEKQCWSSIGYCWCVDTESGKEITGTRTRGDPHCKVTFTSKADVDAYVLEHSGKGNDEVLDECKTINEECLKAAWLPHQTAMCFIQFGLCVATRIFKCTKDCLPGLVTCKLHAIGSWAKLFKCTTDFIDCAKAGCPNGTLIYGPNALSKCQKEVIEKTKIHRHGTFIPQCKADGTYNEKQCWGSIGYCWCVDTESGKEIKGSRTRGDPHCKVTITSQADVDMYMKLHSVEGNDEVLDMCKSINEECLKAAWLPHQTALCFIQFGLCCGTRIFKCVKDCIPPMIVCKFHAIGSWAKLFKCTVDFIDCAKAGCPHEPTTQAPSPTTTTAPTTQATVPVTTAEPTTLRDTTTPTTSAPTTQATVPPTTDATFTSQADVDLYMKLHRGENDEVLDECKAINEQCLKDAWLPHQTALCFIQFGLCVGTRIFKCAKDCLPGLVTCKLHAIGSWAALFKCTTDFIDCAKAGCPHELSIERSHTDLVVYSRLDQCMDDVHACIASAGTDLGKKLRCYAGFGVCIGVCAFKCVGPMVVCKLMSLGDLGKIAMCCAKFLVCAKDACSEGPGMTMIDNKIDEYAAYDMAIAAYSDVAVKNDVLDKCRAEHKDCVAAAGDLTGKIQCFVKFGSCIKTVILQCSASCIPWFLFCSAMSGGDYKAMLDCGIKYLDCAGKACHKTNQTELAVPAYTGVVEYGDLDKCVQDVQDCTSIAGRDVKAQVKCYIQFGLCMGSCSAQCVPSWVLCRILAYGDEEKVVACCDTFLTCAKHYCEHPPQLTMYIG